MRGVSATAARHGMNLTEPLVMVSGGPDSVALLRVLLEFGARPRVVHFDHGLRGDESDADASFVRNLCEELDVPCRIERLYFPKKSGLQEAARRERYRIAGEIALDSGSTCIATGHNSGDVAETLLMNLARGSGMRGAASIPPVSESSGATAVRPLIATTRAEILGYLDDIRQGYRTDSSNSEGKYSRNRVRLGVIPALDEMYPGAARNLTRAAEGFRRDLGVMEELASRAVTMREGEAEVEIGALPHPGLLGHALRVAYAAAAPGEPPLGGRLVEEISARTEKHDGTRELDLPGGIVCAVRFGGTVVFRRGEAAAGSVAEVEIPVGGGVEFEGWTVRADKVGALDRRDAARPEVCYLDAAGGTYRVRSVREGDSMRPLGLGGRKKVFKAMIDRKVPKDVRGKIPVVVGASGEVAWVFLGEIGEKYAVGSKTKSIIRLEISGGIEF